MSVALVLAGGGVTGIAWETGVLLGLRDEGVDVVATADTVLGTSAGAAVGAQVLGGSTDLADLYERQLADDHQELTPELDVDALAEIFLQGMAEGLKGRELRRHIGALALAAPTVSEARRRAVIEWRLPSHDWPERRLLITAVDTGSGELTLFDAGGGVGLVDAVAASCAVPGVWPPVTIGDRRYMDGGVRSIACTDVVGDHDVIIVVAPLTGPAGSMLDGELAKVRAGGAAVEAITTDDEAGAAMGSNPLDPARRAPAARHGRRQGAGAADRIRRVVAGNGG
jgi:NTE family protein